MLGAFFKPKGSLQNSYFPLFTEKAVFPGPFPLIRFDEIPI